MADGTRMRSMEEGLRRNTAQLTDLQNSFKSLADQMVTITATLNNIQATINKKEALHAPHSEEGGSQEDDRRRSSHQETPKYGYSASDGPAKWASLSPEYKQCSSNISFQSPINIEPEEAKSAKDLELKRDYEPFINDTVLVNTGTHVELRLLPDHGSTTFNGSTYNLAYLRFHTHAEHTIKNKTFPLELQIVHQDQSGNELIVSQLYRLGNADTFLYQLRQELKSLGEDNCGDDEVAQIVVEDELKTKSLKKSGGRYYGYVGSQTVPPCKPGVLWFISKKVRTLSPTQLEALQGPLKSINNARHAFTRSFDDVMKYDD